MPEQFVNELANYRSPGVFNPWGECDAAHDRCAEAPQIRRAQLQHYLGERIGQAKLLLVAEAIGYQGGHFSGIPMTSERLLLGGLTQKGILPEHAFTSIAPQRTSKESVRQDGFTEPTATIVWGFFADSGIDPRSFVLWNAFPWHPYKTGEGLLTNRTPTDDELTAGHRILHRMIKLGDFRQIVAVGKKSAAQMANLGIDSIEVRHPANGGAGLFRRQMADLIRGA
ncbi:MAG TPA: uracil-DNA glycosylase [Geopsychrobacteraceae bacterium]|nr:uracil-DNA glycosylase [Geopsychrobacteraceae bacterium]